MLAKLTVGCDGACWTVRCESATWRWNCGAELLTISAIGPETAMRSIRALLFDPQAKPVFNLETDDMHKTLEKPKRGKLRYGFEVRMARLERGAYHLVAIAKVEGIILDLSEDRLWETLTSTAYSTPLIRGWIGSIMSQLKNHRLLEESRGFNGTVGVLDLLPDTLDELVSKMVGNGTLQLTA